MALIERRDREIERLLDALMQEKRENARLREALKFYADSSEGHVFRDGGDIARAALGEEK